MLLSPSDKSMSDQCPRDTGSVAADTFDVTDAVTVGRECEDRVRVSDVTDAVAAGRECKDRVRASDVTEAVQQR